MPLFTVREAAHILRIPVSTLRRKVAQAGLVNVGTPARPRYRAQDILTIG